MKKKLFFLFVASVFISAQGANPKEFKNFRKESSPNYIGKKLSERFVSVLYRNFDEIPGPPPWIVYPETCTWFGALQFAKITKDKKLSRRLEERFFPLLGTRKELMQKPNHVDNTVFGVIPLQLYMITGNKLYYYLGMDFADRQWELPSNTKHEKKYQELLDTGLTWQTRFWIDDMYMITAIQSQAYLATKDEKYINRAAFEMTAYLDSIQRPNGLFYHAPNAPFF